MRRSKKDSNTAAKSVDLERTPPDAAEHPDRFAADELIGESEYSTREAGEREVSRHSRVPGGPADREPLSALPDGLGRRYLEDATESPGPEDLDPAPDSARDDAPDLEQTATRIDGQRDRAADPLSQNPPRRKSRARSVP